MFKKRSKKKNKKKLLYIFFLLGIFLSFKLLNKSKIEISNKEFSKMIISNTFIEKENILEKVVKKTKEVANPVKVLQNNYQTFLEVPEESKDEKKETEPIVYLYNSHPTEEYLASTYAEFSVNPTVIINNYILEDILDKNNIETIVEEQSVTDILKNNNWKYYESYRASRILLEQSIVKYPTLKYFIDIHRDSLEREKTTYQLNEKDYAKIIFIVGLENKNYQNNLELTERINQKLNEKYPGLSKGILQKKGAGVNGVYNQDFSPNTILVEIGGYQNNTTEVLNTTLAFADCFMEVINEESV